MVFMMNKLILNINQYIFLSFKLLRLFFILLFDFIVAYAYKKNNKLMMKKLLLIRLDELGDFFLWMQSAKYYRRIFSESKIYLLANSNWSECAKLFNYWDEIIPVDVYRFNNSIKYRLNIIKLLSKHGFTITISPRFSRNFKLDDIFTFICQASHKFGMVSDNSNRNIYEGLITNIFYDHLIKTNEEFKFEVDRDFDFIQKLNFYLNNNSIEIINPDVHTPSSNIIKEKYFIVVPGASWDGKRWDVNNFNELIIKIHNLTNWLPVLCGSNSEVSLSTKIINNSKIKILDFIGKTNVTEYINLIKQAQLVIGNDSSSIHIAAFYNIKSFVVAGGGHWERFLPYTSVFKGVKPTVIMKYLNCYGCSWKCHNSEYNKIGTVPCIKVIKTSDVWNPISLYLNTIL